MSTIFPNLHIIAEAERDVLKAVPPGTPPGYKGKETNVPKVARAAREALELLLFMQLPELRL